MEEKTVNFSSPIKIFFKNLMLEFLLSLLLLLILSVMLSYTNLSEEIITPAIVFISSFCILLGSFLTSRKINVKGIVIGILQGIVYMLSLYIYSSILSKNFAIGSESIVMIVIGVACGALGGIIGANLK